MKIIILFSNLILGILFWLVVNYLMPECIDCMYVSETRSTTASIISSFAFASVSLLFASIVLLIGMQGQEAFEYYRKRKHYSDCLLLYFLSFLTLIFLFFSSLLICVSKTWLIISLSVALLVILQLISIMVIIVNMTK